MKIYKNVIIVLLSYFSACKALLMNPEDKSYLMSQNVSEEVLFIATMYTDSPCSSVQLAIETKCIQVDSNLDTSGNELVDFENGYCIFRFQCDFELVTSGALEIDNDDIVSIEKDQRIIIQNYNWGLDRIDQTNLPLNGNQFTTAQTGSGVNIYIVDTGIDLDHEQFENRAFGAIDVIQESGDEYDDYNGHGTHCAGIAAGKDVGVAKDATIFSVKALSRSGSGSFFNAAAAVKSIIQRQKHNYAEQPCVISMSFGGPSGDGKYGETAMTQVVEEVASIGHIAVVAAGNDNDNACKYTPANAKGRNVITVGATNVNDKRAWFSNYGKCVNMWAPGVDIFSSWKFGGYNTISGTSMATPMVAGVAATLLEKNNMNSKLAVDELYKLSIDKNNKLFLQSSRSGTPSPSLPPTKPLGEPKIFVSDFSINNFEFATFSQLVYSGNTISGSIVYVNDACEFIKKSTSVIESSVKNKFVIYKRGGPCRFYDVSSKLTQGNAIAVLIINNVKNGITTPIGSGPIVTVPTAMISKNNGELILKKYLKDIVYWGLESDNVIPPETKNFEDYFESNVLSNNKMCGGTGTVYVKGFKNSKITNLEDCATSCLDKNTCTHISFRDIGAVRCRLIKECVVQDSNAGWMSYKKVIGKRTNPPTIDGFYSYFIKANPAKRRRCVYEKRPNHAIKTLILDTIEKCGNECLENLECNFINYNDEKKRCDLMKKCELVKSKSTQSIAYRKINDKPTGNSDGNGNGTHGVFDTLFSDNIVSDSISYCDDVSSNTVVEYDLQVSIEECSKKCAETLGCEYINYYDSPYPCTLLSECNLIAKTENLVSSYSNNDQLIETEAINYNMSEITVKGVFIGIAFVLILSSCIYFIGNLNKNGLIFMKTKYAKVNI